MATNNRGRHKRNNSDASSRIQFKGTYQFTEEGAVMLEKWKKLTDRQKADYGYNFESYRRLNG